MPMRMRLLAILGLLIAGIANAEIGYHVTPDLTSRSILVTVTLPQAGEKPEFRIPAWCPGFYTLKQYAQKIFDTKATDPDGNPLSVTNPDPRIWKVTNPKGGDVSFSYRVLGDDPGLGFFGVNVVSHTAFINGPAGFVFVPNRKSEACRVRFTLPDKWEIATGMQGNNADGFLSGDYDELIDHPFQLGTFEKRQFTLRDIPFEVIFVSPTGQFQCDFDQETAWLKMLSEPAIEMMGGAPFKRYVYILHLAVGNFGGGLEHRASTVINITNSKVLALGDLAAHEFFHSWNVKQIRPIELGPFD